MSIYVATKAENWWGAALVAEYLGIPISHEWWHDVKLMGPGAEKAGEERVAVAQHCAHQDVDGARNADAVVVLAYPDMAGAFIEMGIALGKGRPVYVFGNVHPIFDWHSLVHCYPATWGGLQTLKIELIQDLAEEEDDE